MARTKYNVYRIGTGFGCYAREYRRDYLGSTFAVSEKQAINNIRHRHGNYIDLDGLSDSLGMGYVTFSLKAFPNSEDPYVEAV